jgi:hypothetical protein
MAGERHGMCESAFRVSAVVEESGTKLRTCAMKVKGEEDFQFLECHPVVSSLREMDQHSSVCLLLGQVHLQRLDEEYSSEGSETSAKLNQSPGKYPKENIQVSEHGENLKSRI